MRKEVKIAPFLVGEAEDELERARRRALVARPAASFQWSDTDPNPAFQPSHDLPFIGSWRPGALGKPEPVEQLEGETVRYASVDALLVRWFLALLAVVGVAGLGHGFGWW